MEEKEVRDAWTNILKLYTRRTLTKPPDRLVALSGIVDYFAEFWRERSMYVAGLWEHQLPYSMLWYNANGATGTGDNLAARPASYRAPSWSWAAVDGETSSAAVVGKGAMCTVQQ
ncbi:hypothetical protein DL770_008730 [Monosporascus sp. CRB-9-2]|nr:hypothetical protein DL770_008730 [Monosporascus sp. CRB-9-2]